MTCFLCDELIDDENNSKEHIFLNCIGGRKTVKNFICKKCNNKSGNEWDSEVDKYLSTLALYFNIKRQRGDVRSEEIEGINGIKYYMHKDRITSDEIEYERSGNEIRITGPSSKRNMQYLQELIGRGEVSGKIEKVNTEIEYTIENINYEKKWHIPPRDSNFSKSIVKSIIAFLASESFDIKCCNLAKRYLVFNAPCCVDYAYDYDFTVERPFGIPFHYIRVFNEESMLYAYFELYGHIKYKITLSDEYYGDIILLEYAFDPNKGEEIYFNDFELVKVERKHPGYLMKAIIDEFNFLHKFNFCFFSNYNYVVENPDLLSSCIEDDKEFIKFFAVPLYKFYEDFDWEDKINLYRYFYFMGSQMQDLTTIFKGFLIEKQKK